jgi:signal transduction histidine kinase/HPt (histidine-containing phosphotransfer) domain-containing protein
MNQKPIKALLLIEDSAGDARLLREMFVMQDSHNTVLTHVESMGDAEKHLAENVVDIIILDLGLPDAQGLAAIRRALAAAPRVALVVLTGLDDEAMAVLALQEGAKDYLIKGQLDTRALWRSLRYAVERRSIEEALRGEKERAKLAQDAAERANRAKSRFLAAISHELRTPLNGILGYAQLLRLDGGLSAVQSSRVDSMLGAGEHLLQMINGVLDLSQIEAGRLEVHTAKTDLHGIAGACLDLVRPTADEKALALNLIVEPGVPRLVMSDPMRLRQILLNLLGNAVKFTDRGSVALRVQVVANGMQLRFEVADTGPGIPPECRDRLFQEFERLDIDATAAHEGAGLGLNLSRRLATLLGGCLGYNDTQNKGSSFWLELPLVPITMSHHPEDVGDASVSPPLAPGTVLRVLVVDDIEMNRDIARSFLLAANHNVVCAKGGAEAIAAVSAGYFDVVLMDVRMPQIDGLEATRRIRALEGRGGAVPIVALTAQAFSEQIEECRSAGMDSHLAKPFTFSSLLEAVAHAAAIGQARAPAESPGVGSTSEGECDKGGTSASSPPVGFDRPEVPVFGSDLPVLNLGAFTRTSAFLDPDKVATYLQTITELGQNLLSGLRERDALTRTRGNLAAAAHTLAGSAGMFGFERLTAVARQFELAVHTGAEEAPGLVGVLSAAVETALGAIHSRQV